MFYKKRINKFKNKFLPCLFLCFGFLFLSNLPSKAQDYGNEWINYSQQYYQIPVFQTGIYRLSYNDLSNAGVVGINPKNIQLFHRGEEQAIFINGENDNSLDPGDYIEFYAEKNDASLDYFLYKNPSNLANPFYNLYSDTTAYFLTATLDNTPGKRMAFSNEAVTSPFQPFHWNDEIQFFSEDFANGIKLITSQGVEFDIYSSDFDTGEGWTSAKILTGQSRTFAFTVPNIYTSGAPSLKPRLEMVIVGDNAGAFTGEVRIGNSAGSLRFLQNMSNVNYQKVSLFQNIEMSDVSGTGQFLVRIAAITGKVRVAYIKVRYPQTYTMGGTNSKYFELPTNVNDISYLDITNPPANATIYDISDKNEVGKIASSLSGGKLQAAIPGTSGTRKLFIHNNSFLTAPIKPVNFLNINPAAFNYLIITHKSLRKSIGGYVDIVQAYADYRASVAGGSYQPLIVEIDLLYNQFSYGEKTPLAIKRFARYMFQNGSPEFIFIIGKSVSLPDLYFNPGFPGQFLDIRKNSLHAAQDLVPTAGFPPSDIALVQSLDNSGLPTPSIPIGRIGASNPQQILNYFNKVIEQEANPNELWQKNIIHLSGGNNEAEQQSFKNFMDAFKGIAEADFLCGRVSTSSKSTTSPVELINISEQVNAGVGLVTFFGHSSYNLTDIEIGRVSDDVQGYKNKGRYPLMIANGCQLGAVFYTQNTLSEDWMYTKDRGCISFISHCLLGYSNPLRRYTDRFYRVAFQDKNFIGKPVGKIIKELFRRYVSHVNFEDVSTSQQMILQGDPAVRFFKASLPDYQTADNQLFLESFNNNAVTAVSDSFKLRAIVSNVGIRDNRPFSVSVKRTFPDGTSRTYISPINYPPVCYQDTITFVIRKEDALNGYGNNRFELTLDDNDEIAEEREDNNTGVLNTFLPTVGVLPILPTEYAIANEQPVLLTALASSLRNEQRAFVFELDTTHLFNSSVKQTTNIASGITATWSVNLLTNNNQDSTVYYWRVNYADAVNDPNTLWGESSFVYIKNSPEGWSQSRFPQFLKSGFSNIKANTQSKSFEFNAIQKRIKVNTFGSTNGGNYITDVNMLFDGLALVFNGSCQNDVIVALAFNRNTGLPYLVQSGNSCGRDPDVANYFSNAVLAANGLNNYLSLVAPGDYVLFFSTGNVNFSTWTSTMKNALAQIGGNPTIYNSLQNGHPYIILGRKAAIQGSASEVLASSISNPTGDAITLDENLVLEVSNGQIASTRIGPAQKWKQLNKTLKISTGDTYQLDLYGITLQGQENLLFSNVTADVFNLSSIDAELFPYLRLKLALNDPVNKTPAQLNKWLVLFDGVPEGFINVDAIGREKYNIAKKQEGENFELEFAFQNISNLNFSEDSLDVQYTFTNQQTLNQVIKYARIKAPQPKETLKFKLNVETKGFGGINTLKVFVNPQILPEIYYENNILLVNFEVEKDRSNPILEVAFDGRQILDGEIVSPNPLISIKLRDENKFLERKDGTGLNVSLKKPCEGCNFELINLNTLNVNFASKQGITQADIQLNNLSNGVYTLQVQGEDAAGNKSGLSPYSINFEVINESTVTNFFPYPNPFSTSTRFVFTLTGQEIPDQMKIQIMTITGKVVREITQNEIGAIRIGNNITEYAWDGRDEFGDQLANGVYLYRVLMKINGQDIKARETSADKAFKNGFGKLYIVR